MTDQSILPIRFYGSNISYFSGKLEMYFRAKGIPYEWHTMTMRCMEKVIGPNTGVTQMPALQLGDGRWMTDTTAIIAWFEEHYPGPSITPTDPVKRFFSLLLEDYADEWLWRPAMHYRWYDDEGAMQLSRHIANELMDDIPAPGFLKRWLMRQRQRRGFTAGDGVSAGNRLQVEAIYHDNLAILEGILQTRPFLLGEQPSLADIAFMGPMFRHFSQDPAPAEIMRQNAPAVAEWTARLWNCSPGQCAGEWLKGIPQDWALWLRDIGTNYLPYLNANAEAVAVGKKRFDCSIGGVSYRGARSSPYRIWCLEQLRGHYTSLAENDQLVVRDLLEQHGCWTPLWQIEHLDSEVNRALSPPFGSNAKMIG